MSGPRLTSQAWRALVCLTDPDLENDDACPCTTATDAELERAGLIDHHGAGGRVEVTPAGLVARGRLAHALERVVP